MNTGMQLTKPQPASSTCSTYHLVACSEPTGRYETTTSVCVSLRIRAMSAVAHVVAAEVDVHQAGHLCAGVGVAVVVDALHECRGAVADADDRDADLLRL